VHPIERLRAVARSSAIDAVDLVRETATALGAFRDDPAGMVAACRRMLVRHPTCGPLWWLTSRVCCAPEPTAEGWRCAEAVDADPTARHLARALPDDATVLVVGATDTVGRALRARGDLRVLVLDGDDGAAASLVRRLDRAEVDAALVDPLGLGAAAADVTVVLLDAAVAGPDRFVAPAGARAAAATARHAGVAVWLVGGVGRFVPGRVFDVVASRLDASGDEPWEAEEEVVPLDLVDDVVGPDGRTPVAAAVAATDCPIATELFREGLV